MTVNIDELKEVGKNIRYRSIDDAVAFSNLKLNAIREIENMSIGDKESNEILDRSDSNNNNIYLNTSLDLSAMNSLNINNLFQDIEEEKENILRKEGLDSSDILANVKGKSVKKIKEEIKAKKDKTKTEKLEKVDGKYNNMDSLIKQAQAQSFSNSLMMTAATITHTTGRKLEFNLNNKDKLSFAKVGDETFAYKNGKEIDKDETIKSLQGMVENLGINNTKQLQSLLKDIRSNPQITNKRDIEKIDNKEKEEISK